MAIRIFKIAGALLLLSVTQAAWAQPIPQLSELLRAQLQNVPQMVDACTDDGSWEATTFYLDVSPYVAIGITSVIQATVTPEFLFVWSRED